MQLIASILLLLATASGIAEADRPKPIKVAVVPGIAVNVDAARVDALGQDLADALSTELLVDAAGGLEVRRQLPVEGLPADCIAKSACTTEVARRLGAAQLLFIVVVDTGAGGAVQIDSTWIEPATGQVGLAARDRSGARRRSRSRGSSRPRAACSPTRRCGPRPRVAASTAR